MIFYSEPTLKEIIVTDPSGVKRGLDCIYEKGFAEVQRKFEERMDKIFRRFVY
jgi:hypothetical protein